MGATSPAHGDSNSQIQVQEPALVRIPEGWFEMGSETGQDNERPVHRVWTGAFEFAVYQVTHSDYARFLKAIRLDAPPNWDSPELSLPDQPAVSVNWFEAVAYCEWLSLATGRRYRLPTEAEWERAARGGLEGKLYPWGDEPPESLPNYATRWKTGPEPVGGDKPNGYGLLDIGANVHEWCSDWYALEYYSVSPESNPRGPDEGSRRSSRGGSWRHYTKVSRCAARSSIPPEFKYADYGFRVARDLRE
ncbi:MAG: formylglycine-generating enzyme family protein [Candidatus Acidiferrales bacterium]